MASRSTLLEVVADLLKQAQLLTDLAESSIDLAQTIWDTDIEQLPGLIEQIADDCDSGIAKVQVIAGILDETRAILGLSSGSLAVMTTPVATAASSLSSFSLKPCSLLIRKGLDPNQEYVIEINANSNRVVIRNHEHLEFDPIEVIAIRSHFLPESGVAKEAKKSPRLIEGYSQKLGDELVKHFGTPPGGRSKWQAHHILPTNVIEKKDYLLDLIWEGYIDVQFIRESYKNGIFLPKNSQDSVTYKLPRHAGSHFGYDHEVSQRLDTQYAKLKESGSISKHLVQSMLDEVIEQTRNDLLQGKFTNKEGNLGGLNS